MSLLLSPFTTHTVTLRNRIVMSPMCQYSANDGFANDWHLVHLGSRAVGGTALIIQEATAVSPEGRISPDDLGIWKDEHIPMLARIVDFVHSQGARIGIQLAHAGRKAGTSVPFKGYKVLGFEEGGWQGWAPSAIAYSEESHTPREMSKEDIEKVKADFRAGARRAVQAGYDIIEIHAAHGYLIHEFYSPISNHRTDEYGGNFEGRIRFLLEVVEEVKQELSDKQALWVRISAVDYLEGGWTIEDSVALAKHLKAAGVHLIDVSTGSIAPGEVFKPFPGYQVHFAEQIRKEADIPVGAVGLILSPEQAEEILQAGQADLILLGRELLRNPHFALQAAQQLDGANIYPPQYLRGFYAKKN